MPVGRLRHVMPALFVSLEVAKLVFSRADTSFVLDSQAFAPGHSLWEIVTNLLFLRSFGLHSGLTWNGVAWSAALEFYVSILFAAVVLLFPRRLYVIVLGLCVAAGLLLYTLSPNTLFVNTDWGILRAAFGFFAGCLVCACVPAAGCRRRTCGRPAVSFGLGAVRAIARHRIARIGT
jgi:peptidoglycan/LPS O-acetylase OafA/YrhL